MEKNWASGKPEELKLVYGLTLEQEPNVFRDVKIFFNHNASKFIVTSNVVDKVEPAQANMKQNSSALL